MELQRGMNANHLKMIAILAMTIDHLCDLMYPGFPAEPVAIGLHIVGRLTAPIMWFFVCEGYYHTHHIKKYMLRMGIFALISHFAYCFAFGISMVPFSTGIFNQTSVMYPLFIAIVVMWMAKSGYTVHVLSDCITSYDKKKLPEMLAYYESKGCFVMTLGEAIQEGERGI